MEDKTRGFDDQRGQIPYFQTHPIEETKKCLEKIHVIQNKWAYVVDLSGKLGTYFEYSSHVFFNFGIEVKKIINKNSTKEEVAEEFRRKLVHCMNRGKHLVVNMETTIPQWKTDFDSETLPLSDLIFVPEKLQKDYKTLLREEDFDVT